MQKNSRPNDLVNFSTSAAVSEITKDRFKNTSEIAKYSNQEIVVINNKSSTK